MGTLGENLALAYVIAKMYEVIMNLKQIVALIILIGIGYVVVSNNPESKTTKKIYEGNGNGYELSIRDKAYESFSPIINKTVSLDEIWKLEMDQELMIYSIEESTLYVLSRNNTLYLVDLESGNLINTFALDKSITGDCRHMSVSNGILALNYEQNIVVFNSNTGEMLWNHVITKFPVVRVGSTSICDNVLMYWDSNREGIVAKDILTHDELWLFGGNRAEHGILSIYQLFNRCFIKYVDDKILEIDPKNLQLVEEYEVVRKGEYWNDDFDSYHYQIEGTTKNQTIDSIFNRNLLGLFRTTNNGRIFSVYHEFFYSHGDNYSVEWKAIFDSKIRSTFGWENYIIIAMQDDKLIIFDLDSKEIVYEEKFRLSGRGYIINYDNQVILSDSKGILTSYDLEKLSD